MRRRTFLAAFDTEADVLEAVHTARERGFTIVDVYTPYPVHGLDDAIGLPPSQLSRVGLVLGAAGAASMLFFQFWVTAIAWPINIGGKPWNSLPAFIPATFETMVLFAAVGTAAVFFARCGLRPGRKPAPFVPGATDRLFVLAIETDDGASDPTVVREIFSPFNVRQVDERAPGTA